MTLKTCECNWHSISAASTSGVTSSDWTVVLPLSMQSPSFAHNSATVIFEILALKRNGTAYQWNTYVSLLSLRHCNGIGIPLPFSCRCFVVLFDSLVVTTFWKYFMSSFHGTDVKRWSESTRMMVGTGCLTLITDYTQCGARIECIATIVSYTLYVSDMFT